MIFKYFFLCKMIYQIRFLNQKYMFYKYIQAISAPVIGVIIISLLRQVDFLSICVIYMQRKMTLLESTHFNNHKILMLLLGF